VAVEHISVNGEFVLYEPLNNQIHLLNDTAQLIWAQNAAGSSSVQIARDLAERFVISESQALSDIERCLSEWAENGLLDTQTTAAVESDPDTPLTGDLPITYTDWSRVWNLNIADTVLEIVFGSTDHESLLSPLLGHLLTDPNAGGQHRIYVWEDEEGMFVQGKQRHSCSSIDQMIESVIYEVIECSCRERDFRAIFHAGAVLDNDSAIMLAGTGGSGKSTLVSALQYYGYSYLNDDICPLDRDNRLIPFPMCQSLKVGSWKPLQALYPSITSSSGYQRFGKQVRYLAPQKIEPGSWKKHWPIGALVFPKYDPESKPAFEQLSSLQALQQLLSSQSLFDQPVQSLVNWLETMPCFSMRYRNLEEGVHIFLKISGVANAE